MTISEIVFFFNIKGFGKGEESIVWVYFLFFSC